MPRGTTGRRRGRPPTRRGSTPLEPITERRRRRARESDEQRQLRLQKRRQAQPNRIQDRLNDHQEQFPRPVDPRWEVWTSYVQQERREAEWLPSSESVLCSKHFRPEDIEQKKTSKQLKKTAVPEEAGCWGPFAYTQPYDPSSYRASGPLHNGVSCTYCQTEIYGHRYMCLQCIDVNLCSSCEHSGCHVDHCVLRLPSPTIYNTVMSCLGPLKEALNSTVSYSKQEAVGVENLDNTILEIKKEIIDEPMIEVDAAAKDGTCLDPLTEPKIEIEESSETIQFNVDYDNQKKPEKVKKTSKGKAKATSAKATSSKTRDILSVAFEKSFLEVEVPKQLKVYSKKRKIETLSSKESDSKTSRSTDEVTSATVERSTKPADSEASPGASIEDSSQGQVKTEQRLRAIFNKYKRKTERGSYSKDKLEEAAQAVKNGDLSGYKASQLYKIPRMTIMDRVNNRRTKSNTLGRNTALTPEAEAELANSLKLMEKHGFRLSRMELLEVVGEYVKKNNISTNFKNGIPGQGWFTAFIKRHNLSIKIFKQN